jgi:hypothetical protein
LATPGESVLGVGIFISLTDELMIVNSPLRLLSDDAAGYEDERTNALRTMRAAV